MVYRSSAVPFTSRHFERLRIVADQAVANRVLAWEWSKLNAFRYWNVWKRRSGRPCGDPNLESKVADVLARFNVGDRLLVVQNTQIVE